MYKHTQFGIVTIVSLLVTGIIAGAAVYQMHGWAGGIVGATIVLVVCLFSSLTVEVDNEAIRIRFGVGLIRKKFRLRDIESVRVVRNSWLYGWGIRYTPHGWLYNVSGLDAIELQLRNGKSVRIGTDEPDTLAAVLIERIHRA